MASDCQKIEGAASGLSAASKPADAEALSMVMNEINASHIVGTRLIQQAPLAAKELEVQNKYTRDLSLEASAAPGSHAHVQQQHGIANTIVLEETGRTEVLRLEADNPVPTPMMSNTTYMCSGKPVTAWSHYRDGKAQLSAIDLPEISIVLSNDGTPRKIVQN